MEFLGADQEAVAARRQRRIVLWGSLALLPFFIKDLLAAEPHTGWLIAVKVFWLMVLWGVAAAMGRVRASQRQALMSAAGAVSSVLMAVVVVLHGDHNTAYFAWLFALPFCVVALVQDDVQTVVVSAVSTFVGAVGVLVLDGASGAELAQWVLSVVTSGGMAVIASVNLRRHLREEHAQKLRLGDAEKRAAHAEKMATVGTLAAGVAHEINNPLASVAANLEFLEQEVANPTAPLEELNLVVLEAQVAIRRIKGIVGDLTAFSRESKAGEAVVDLRSVVDEAERLAAQRTGHQIGIQSLLPQDLPKVMGNQRHLAQVFLNLLINAADAIDETSRTDGQIWIRAAKKGEAVTIDVDDNGAGLPAPVLKQLFVPFFTTRAPKRTGLGLATSREYLRRAGGDLTATPRPEGGARFTVALRAAP